MCITVSFIYQKDLIQSEYIFSNESSAEFYLLQSEKQKYLDEIKKQHTK